VIAIDNPTFTREGPSSTDRPAPTARTLRQAAFDDACADLLGMARRDGEPDLLIGIRTGGLVVAESMARAAAYRIPVMPLTCRRPGTRLKSRIPGLKAILTAMPEPWLNALRQAEHRLLTARRRTTRAPEVDQSEANAIGACLARKPVQTRVLIADDAVDSGATLAAVLATLREVCPPGTELRTAVITVTLDDPIIQPDHALWRGVLCRFPWSFDAAA